MHPGSDTRAGGGGDLGRCAVPECGRYFGPDDEAFELPGVYDRMCRPCATAYAIEVVALEAVDFLIDRAYRESPAGNRCTCPEACMLHGSGAWPR